MACNVPQKPMAVLDTIPSEIGLQIMQGVKTQLEFILTDERGEVVDLTLDTVELNVRDYFGGTLQIEKSNGPGEHEDPVNGQTRFAIEKGDISAMTENANWVYEIRRLLPSGDEAVHIHGPFFVSPAVGS